MKGTGSAKHKLLAAILIPCVAVAIIVAILVPAFQRAAESRRRQICANNLRQMGTAFRMYAEDWSGRFPQSQIDNRDPNDIKVSLFFFNGRAVFPGYLKDPGLLICPSDSYGVEEFESGCWNLNGDPSQPFVPAAFDALSYVYFPWATTNDDELEAMVRYAIREIKSAVDMDPQNLSVLDQDMILSGTPWEGMGSAPGGSLYRVRLGIERFYITDINMPAATAFGPETRIPIMMDWAAGPLVAGANVLFIDGHVEFLRAPGDFPVSDRSGASLLCIYEAMYGVDFEG